MTNPIHRSIRAAWEARKIARNLERKDQPTNAARARAIQRAYMDEARKLKEKI